MTKKRFTDTSIKALKLTKNPNERYEVFDSSGFGVRVGQRTKTFIFVYHHQGRPRRLSLGCYPAMRLADARVALAAARKMLAHGDDPGKKAVEQRRAARESETVTELVDLYINLHARPKKRSWRGDQRALQANVIPAWGHRRQGIFRAEISLPCWTRSRRGVRRSWLTG